MPAWSTVSYTHLMLDVLVIGCGIVGAAAAMELSKYQLQVAVLEKENDLELVFGQLHRDVYKRQALSHTMVVSRWLVMPMAARSDTWMPLWATTPML